MDRFIRKAIVAIGLVLVYFKTAEVMVQFSPRSILGWTDANIGIFWAYVAAGLVEGVAYLAFRNLLNLRKDGPTKRVSWGIAIGAVLFSATLNLIDQQITDGKLVLAADNPVATGLHAVIGLLPLIVAVAFAALEIVDHYFADSGEQPAAGQRPYQVTSPQRAPARSPEATYPPSRPIPMQLGSQSDQPQLSPGGKAEARRDAWASTVSRDDLRTNGRSDPQ